MADALNPSAATAGLRRLACALLTFVIVALLATNPGIQRWDDAVTFRLIRSLPDVGLPAAILDHLANAEVMIPIIVLLALVRVKRDQACGIHLFRLAALLAVGSVVTIVLKCLIVHPGPSPSLHSLVFREGFQLEAPYTFPSGHVLRLTVIAGTALRRVPLLSIFLLVALAVTLVYRRAHWPSDVIGGMSLGWVLVETAALVPWARPA